MLSETVIEPVLAYLDQEDPGEVAGVYLYCSASRNGLRPDSDIDLLILTHRSLTPEERASLVARLLSVSGWKGHASQFPEVADRLPLDLTILVIPDMHPLTDAPWRDFQFGEWMREELLAGHTPAPSPDPDVVILLATALSSHQVLRGPALESIIGPVPPKMLQRAQLAVVPGLVSDLVGDERNVLLTLARILVTIETGQVFAKDLAAELVAPRLTGQDRVLLERARDDYVGKASTDGEVEADIATSLAQSLVGLIEEAAGKSLFDALR